MCNDKKIVQSILDKGAQVNVIDNDGNTPFMIACIHDNKDIIQALLNKGATTSTY
jgi:ankyrin repeat protein